MTQTLTPWPDTLFGSWAIEPGRFRRMFEIAKAAAAKSQFGADDDDGTADYSVTSDGTAIIQVVGPLTKYLTLFTFYFGGTSMQAVRGGIRKAASDQRVRALLIVFDTPGGTVAGTADLAEDIRTFRATGKLCYAYVSDLCASAGYWLASQCDKIIANTTALVGCIGTYSVLQDVTGALEQEGIKLTVVSTGQYKGLGADGAVTDDLVADIQREVNDLNELFIRDVAQGRKRVLSDDEVRKLADGRMHVGEKAKALGLVDQIATIDAALSTITADTVKRSQAVAADAERKARDEARRRNRVAEAQRAVAMREAVKASAPPVPKPPPGEKMYRAHEFADTIAMKYADFSLWRAQGHIPAPAHTKNGQSFWPESVVAAVAKKLRRPLSK